MPGYRLEPIVTLLEGFAKWFAKGPAEGGAKGPAKGCAKVFWMDWPREFLACMRTRVSICSSIYISICICLDNHNLGRDTSWGKFEKSPAITLFFKEYLKNFDTKIEISPEITLFFLGLAVVTMPALAKMLWKREPTESPIWVTNTHH